MERVHCEVSNLVTVIISGEIYTELLYITVLLQIG